MRITTLVTLALIVGAFSAKQVLVDLTKNLEANELYMVDLKDEVQVKLRANPSTGFSWVLVNRASNDVQVLDLTKEEYVPDHQSEED